MLIFAFQPVKEAAFLLVTADVQVHLDDAVSVLVKVLFPIANLPITLGVEIRVVRHARRHGIALLHVVHTRHKHILVVAAIHHADFPARRNGADDTPEIIMAEFFLTGRFECRDFQRRRVQLPKHLFDEAVLARRVTRLNGNQDALTPLRIEFILQCRRFRKVLHRLRLERFFIHELRRARLRVL